MNLLKNNREVLFFLLVILYISLIILKPLFSLYFWRDDFFILYKASHYQSSFWPYYIAHSFYIPLWHFFKLTPNLYFLTNFFLRMIIAASYFLVLKRVTNNSYFSFFTAALWSVSPIGFDSNILIVTSISTFFASLFQILFIYFFFLKKFILTIVFIFIAFLITPDRGGGLLFFSFFLFSNQNTSQLAAGMNGLQKNLPEGILRSLLRSSSLITPFIKARYVKIKFLFLSLLSAILGVFISRILSSHDSAWANNIVSFEIILKNLLDIKAFFFLFISSLIPSDLWISYINSSSIISVSGVLLFVLILLLLIKIKKNSKFIYILTGLLWVVSNLLIIYLFQPYLNASEERYYSSTSLGGALLIISIFFLLPKRVFFTLSCLAILTFGIITNSYLNAHLSKHSYYAKPFWQAFKNEVPAIKNKTLFVINLQSRNTEILNRYADIVRVGAIVSEASIAVHLGTDLENIKLTDNWDEKQLSNDINFAKNNNYDIVYFLYNGKDLKKVSERPTPL